MRVVQTIYLISFDKISIIPHIIAVIWEKRVPLLITNIKLEKKEITTINYFEK